MDNSKNLFGCYNANTKELFINHSLMIATILLVASFVIGYKHRENYVRIYKGTEIRFRKANRGDYRVK